MQENGPPAGGPVRRAVRGAGVLDHLARGGQGDQEAPEDGDGDRGAQEQTRQQQQEHRALQQGNPAPQVGFGVQRINPS